MNLYDFSELDFFFNDSGLFGQQERFEQIFDYLDQNMNILNLPFMTNLNIMCFKFANSGLLSGNRLYDFYLILKFNSQNSEQQKELLEKFELVDDLDFCTNTSTETIFDIMNDDVLSEFMCVEQEIMKKCFIGPIGYNLISLDKKIQKFVLKMDNLRMIFKLTYFISFGKDYQQKDFKKDFVSRYNSDFLVAVSRFDHRTDPVYILNLILTMNYYKKSFLDFVKKNYIDEIKYDIHLDILSLKEYGISSEIQQLKKEFIQINQILEKEISILNYISFVYFLKSEAKVFLKIKSNEIGQTKSEILQDLIIFCSDYIEKFPSQEIVREMIFFKENLKTIKYF
jgi:hypothetical protein